MADARMLISPEGTHFVPISKTVLFGELVSIKNRSHTTTHISVLDFSVFEIKSDRRNTQTNRATDQRTIFGPHGGVELQIVTGPRVP